MGRAVNPRTIEEVVAGGLCTGCGLCASIGGASKVQMGLNQRGHMRPLVLVPLDAVQQRTFQATCPGISVTGPGHVAEGRVHPIWGPVRRIHRSWSAEPDVRFKAAAGGTLTALGRYLLASGEVEAVLHVRADPERPYLTRGVVSTTPEEVLAGAQSRYGPSDPLTQLHQLLDEGLHIAVIAKPCDISAVRALAKVDPRVDRQVRYLLTIFCGGVHHAHVPRAIMRDHGIDERDVTAFRYRGEGWPGTLHIDTRTGKTVDLPYPGGWLGKKWFYDMQFRCKICPDAVGENADVSAPDGWIVRDGKPLYDEAPGRNIAIARTERGERLLDAAVRAGFLELAPMTVRELEAMHANHPPRKMGGPVQLAVLRVLRQPSLRAPGYRPWTTLRHARPAWLWGQLVGTVRRVLNRENREPLI